MSSISINFLIFGFCKFNLYNFDFPIVLVGIIISFLTNSSHILYNVALPIPAFLAMSDIEKSSSRYVKRKSNTLIVGESPSNSINNEFFCILVTNTTNTTI